MFTREHQMLKRRKKQDYDTMGCKYIYPSKPDGNYVIINHDPPDIRHNGGLDSDPVTVSEEYFFSGLSSELDSMLKHLDSLLEHKAHPGIKTKRQRINYKYRGTETQRNDPLYIALVFILFILFIIALVCCTGMV